MESSRLNHDQLVSLRRHLLDSALFLKLADSFIDHAVAESDSDDTQFLEYFRGAMQAITQENADEVSRLAGSPIEKTFLNSLILSFIKNDGLGLLVHSIFKDTITEVAQFRTDLKRFREFVAWFETNKPTDTMEQFLDEEMRRGKMSQEERGYLTRLIFRYCFIPMDENYHMSLQPRFPDVKVGGRSIRPDIYFWIPSQPDVKIIVECDGYAFHSDKEKFTTDRQRDRALKSLGYEVFRFSGSEIVGDPVSCAHELATYLWQRAEAPDLH